MADLSLPFWLASTRLEKSASIPDWLKSIHLQTRWFDEIIFIPANRETQFPRLPGGNDQAIYRSTNQGEDGLRILHDACREIITGDRHMTLLICETLEATLPIILVSPAAAGIYNLSPIAYMDARLAFHLPEKEANLLMLLQDKLKKKEKSPSQLDLLAFRSRSYKQPVKSETPFEKAAWLKAENGEGLTGLTACHDLVAGLISKNKKNGLVVEVSDEANVSAIWIERICNRKD